MNFPSFPWLLHESALNFSTPERHYWCLCFPKSLFGCMATDWQALSVSRLSSCVTGALSSEKTLPPVAGAALHPGADDPGHVYPHITFTGQLSQHQAVHIPMRPTETGFKKKKKTQPRPPSSFGSSHRCLVMFHHVAGTALEQPPEPLEVRYAQSPKLEGGWRTTRKDTADVVKPEVWGSIDACDQGQFGWRWLWMWIYCTVSCFPLSVFVSGFLAAPPQVPSWQIFHPRHDWCRD